MSGSSGEDKSAGINCLLSYLPDMDVMLPYEMLAQFSPGLYLDVGAAAGFATRLMLLANPEGKVIAFEPFSGNIPHLKDVLKDFENWSLVPKAVADFSGDGAFFVSSTVKGTEEKWQKRAGYSSVGFLVPVEKVGNYDPTKTETVPVCKIDDHVNEHVQFMKIDVQGTEFEVLQGAKETIRQHGISVIHTEFTGDIRLLNFLHDLGYIIFDTDYMLIPLRNDPQPEDIGMLDYKIANLSTGQQAYEGPIVDRPADFEGYCNFMAETIEKYGFFHTDLYCVHPSFMNQFLTAVSDAYQAKPRRSV